MLIIWQVENFLKWFVQDVKHFGETAEEVKRTAAVWKEVTRKQVHLDRSWHKSLQVRDQLPMQCSWLVHHLETQWRSALRQVCAGRTDTQTKWHLELLSEPKRSLRSREYFVCGVTNVPIVSGGVSSCLEISWHYYNNVVTSPGTLCKIIKWFDKNMQMLIVVTVKKLFSWMT